MSHFCERGTNVATFDYAHYNETILGNTSVIFCIDCRAHGLEVDGVVFTKFAHRFPVLQVNTFSELEMRLKLEDIDLFYILQSGTPLGFPFGTIHDTPVAFHCVFNTCYPQGTVHLAISDQLNIKFGTQVPVVPHMVTIGDTNETLRSTLGIPIDAIVFGRYGGYEQFDIEYVHQVVAETPNRWFIFMNTEQFCDLPNVIFLPKKIDIEEKRRFINTCDALLHARSSGETFGLSCAEFAICEKPVITCSTFIDDDAHLQILGEKAIRYSNKEELKTILQTFRPGQVDMKQNGYMKYTPDYVMKLFDELIIQQI